MVTVLRKLEPFTDAETGNCVEYEGEPRAENISIKFRGNGNRLVVAADAKIFRLSAVFDCSNGVITIGGNSHGTPFRGTLRVGQDSRIVIGHNVSSTDTVYMSAAEGTTIEIGEDVMFATGNQLRADDGHPIFDVRTGKRVNVSRDITVGNHVWLGYRAMVLGGVTIGDGSVIGCGSVVTRRIPNNVVAVGVPAHVVRRDIAWERPHLTLAKPYYKPDARTVKKSAYWHLTADDGADAPIARPSRTAEPIVRPLRARRRTWRSLVPRRVVRWVRAIRS
ncbi:MAG: acyltransferase [Actinomycetales bacterium]|nr:acyltransferase [Actinomycetales bacterium]